MSHTNVLTRAVQENKYRHVRACGALSKLLNYYIKGHQELLAKIEILSDIQKAVGNKLNGLLFIEPNLDQYLGIIGNSQPFHL